jgi:glycosyltransferase involved in cell wall biosynthesis
VSGENRVVDDEARLLRAAGHHVVVHDPSPDPTAGKVRAGSEAIWSRREGAEVRRLVAEHRVEVVHCHNLIPALSPAVIRAARAAGAAVVMTLHNYRLLCLPATLYRDGSPCALCVGRAPLPGVRYACYRGSRAASAAIAASLVTHRAAKTFDRVSRFLAISAFVRDRHVEGGIARGRIAVRPNFAWPAEPRDGPGDYFLALGRLTPEKGLDTLLDAWRAGIGARLVVVGDGPDAGRLRATAPPGVEVREPVPASEVPALIRGARAALVPSRWPEPAGRVVLEAYAAGVPVIASTAGALPEFVSDGETGLLVEPGNPDAWRAAVERLCEDELSLALGARGRSAWAERYAPERALTSLESEYRAAIEPN